ncbi:MAG: hypothetical protein M1834_006913 [Cirrosporium novae-zelandiae]|nr:MAG: hypothetical protein M1834_006913 [Cirrosporium novae-zelandiae]
MPPSARERHVHRRKIALACDPCRERKSRCDGGKPICSSCQRRSFGIHQCVYKTDNARTASNDAYIKVLHDRIRELEQACINAGATIPALIQSNSDNNDSNLRSAVQTVDDHRDVSSPRLYCDDQVSLERQLNSQPSAIPSLENGAIVSRSSDHLAGSPIGDGETTSYHPFSRQQTTDNPFMSSNPLRTSDSTKASGTRTSQNEGERHSRNFSDSTSQDPGLHSSNISEDIVPTSAQSAKAVPIKHVKSSGSMYDGFPLFDQQSQVTGMGAIATSLKDEESTEHASQYYGSSSAASLMQLVHKSISIRSGPNTNLRSNPQQNPTSASTNNTTSAPGAPESAAQGPPWNYFSSPLTGDLSLPPRSLADHLLQRYWERVYYLYPFIHRPSFQRAYECLWLPAGHPSRSSHCANVGLGGSSNDDSNSLVFLCALNSIFALGCHFSDLPSSERATVAHTFFLRSKSFIGLDFLEVNNIGIVQALLIVAQYLQSTPYPSRCWNAVGVACRVAQGLGLHVDLAVDSCNVLETEMRRRVWHGCTLMDRFVAPLSIYDLLRHAKLLPQGCEHDIWPTNYDFTYISHSLAIYTRRRSNSFPKWGRRTAESGSLSNALLCGDHQVVQDPGQYSLGSLSAMVKQLDMKLARFESSLPNFLSWTSQRKSQNDFGDQEKATYQLQMNVLHARFIYLKMMLHRPLFAQMCRKRDEDTRIPSSEVYRSVFDSSIWSSNMLYSSFATRCAVSCVMAAMDLLDLIHGTYQTPAAGEWWYNGLYASSAGIVLILAQLCLPIMESLDRSRFDKSFGLCDNILKHLTSFSVSGQNALNLLQKLREHLAPIQPAPEQQESLRTQTYHSLNQRQPETANTHPGEPMTWTDELGNAAMGSSFFNWDPTFELMPDEFGINWLPPDMSSQGNDIT